MDFPSHSDLVDIGVAAAIATPGTKIDPSQWTTQGSDANLFVNVGAAFGDECIRQLSIQDQGVYLDSCDGGPASGKPVGPQLAKFAFDRYQLTSKPASAAIGFVQMSRPTAGAGALTLKAGTRIQATVPGRAPIVYTLTSDVQFSALGLIGLAGASSNLPVAATTTGLASGVAASGGPTGPTWSFVDQTGTPVFDPTIVIVNAEQTIGSDAEDSAQFTARVRGYFPTVQKGTLQAIQNGALSVANVAQAVAVEVTNAINLPPGLSPADAALVQAAIGDEIPAEYVLCYVGDVNGNSNTAMLQAVRTQLLSFRAAGIYVQVIGQIPQLVYVTLQGVAIPAGVDPEPIETALINAIVLAVNQNPAGQNLLVGNIFTAANNAKTGATIPQNAVLIGTSPSNLSPLDLIPASPSQTFRTIAPNIQILG